jgi:nitroreductase
MAMNETIKSIMNRRSTRAYRQEQIKGDELDAIIEAGIYAPSASNGQPWHFSVIQKKDLLDRLNDDFIAFAKQSDIEYLRKFGNTENFHVFYHAPTAIIISGDENSRMAVTDTAATAQNILIAAESLNIGSCWIGLINLVFGSKKGPEYYEEIGIPDGFKFLNAIALGYKKDKPADAPARKENIINYIK